MKRMCPLLAIFVTMAFAFVSPISGSIVFPIPEPDSSAFTDRNDSVYDFFTKMQSRHPEKLYLHLNQPYYG
ncbi:MAG: hypothetical protein HP046_07955, partial [Parabacteroides sp.]|nr:hypothetical protein [Parabacteroides sp.]